jgi:hypothetical protein
MNARDANQLRVGDRVRWTEPGNECPGTVAELLTFAWRIAWDDHLQGVVNYSSLNKLERA